MNNLDREILKYVVKKLKDKKIPSDKIVVQKLLFYLKESGIPISYNYEMYAYGPYAKKLNSDAEYLALENQLLISNVAYQIGNGYKDENPIRDAERIDKKIDDFSDLVDRKFNFDSMEIFGTTLYCYNALKKIGLDPSFENVVEEFKAWKGEKYSDTLIHGHYQRLVKGKGVRPLY